MIAPIAVSREIASRCGGSGCGNKASGIGGRCSICVGRDWAAMLTDSASAGVNRSAAASWTCDAVGEGMSGRVRWVIVGRDR